MRNLSFLFLIFPFLFSCTRSVESTSPKHETITESVYASGIVKSASQYQVYARVNGVLTQWRVKEGDPVHKGQVICSIANDVSRLTADNAALAARNADLKQNTDRLRELEWSINASKQKMDNDRTTLERQRNLWKEEIGTKFELEQRELAYANSKAAYESALLRYNELKKQLSFTADQSHKNLSISRSMLSDYDVRSEVDGKVYATLKEKGEMVGPQVPIAVIGDAKSFTLHLQVDENDIVKVVPGQTVYVAMDSYKGRQFDAVVRSVNPLMDERSRSFEVEAEFTRQPEVLYPNLTLEANIVLQHRDKALTIPRKYLIDDEYVLISKTEKKKVKVGLMDFQKAEILEGLSSSDKIYMPAQ